MTNIVPTKRSTVPDDAAKIGVDQKGRTHYHAGGATDHRIFVSDGHEALVFDLGGEPVDEDDWVAHVDAWAELCYDQPLVDTLAAGVEQ